MIIVRLLFNDITEFVNMEMSETERKFASAALAVFKRFGVRKATMEEIAREAGVSKPTLYGTFGNKDAALGGAIRLAKGTAIQTVVDAWENVDTLPDKLDIFFHRLVLDGFDTLHNSPDASAFDTALGDASHSAVTETREAEIDAMLTVVNASEKLAVHGLEDRSFASFIVTSAMNAKRNAQSRNDLEQYLGALKVSVLRLLCTD